MAKTKRDEQRDKRCDELFALGLKFDGEHYASKERGIFVHHLDILVYNEAKWQKTLTEIEKRMKEKPEQPAFNFGEEAEHENNIRTFQNDYSVKEVLDNKHEGPKGIELTPEELENLPFEPDPIKTTPRDDMKVNSLIVNKSESKAQDLVVLNQPIYLNYQKQALNQIVLATKITAIENDVDNSNAREVGKALTDLSKEINKVRLATNKQWDKLIEDNNTEAKKIITPLDEHVNRIKTLVNKYETAKEQARLAEIKRLENIRLEQEKKDKEERERKEKIQAQLKSARQTAQDAISKDDYDALIAIEQKINGWQPKQDFYKEFMKDALALKEELLSAINLKKPILEQIKAQKEEANRLDGVAKEQAQKELALQQEALNQKNEAERLAKAEKEMADQKAEIAARQELTILVASMGVKDVEKTLDELIGKYQTAVLATANRDKIIEDFMAKQVAEKQAEALEANRVKNQRTDFLFNIVDESLVPREFLKVDETKIRAAIQEHRKLLEKDINSYKISGVEIHSEKKTILK